MPAAAAVLLESEARARAAARLRARRNGGSPGEQEPPTPRLAPLAAQEVAATLERALRLSRGPAGSYLLASDSAVDIGVLRDPGAVSATTVHSGLRKTMHTSFPPARLANMHVPFLNLGTVNIGLAVGRVELGMTGDGDSGGLDSNDATAKPNLIAGCNRSGSLTANADASTLLEAANFYPLDANVTLAGDAAQANGDVSNLVSRLMVMGRYARDEQTGEMLTILRDLRPNVDLVSLLWLGPALGDFVRERLDIVCDASLFSSGRMHDSVLRCERTVRVGGGIPAGLLPEGPLDMRHCRPNMGHLAGSSQDFLMGLPAFQEQLEINDPSARDHLMSIAVQSKVGNIQPGALGVEAAVTLYKTALDISMLRLSQMTISAGVETSAQDGIVQNAADSVTIDELNGCTDDIEPESGGGDFLVDQRPLGGRCGDSFLPRATDEDPTAIRASASNDTAWLMLDYSAAGLYSRDGGEALCEPLGTPPRSPDLGNVKRARTDRSVQNDAENFVSPHPHLVVPQHETVQRPAPTRASAALNPPSAVPVKDTNSDKDVNSAAKSAVPTKTNASEKVGAPAVTGNLAKSFLPGDNQSNPDEVERKKAIRRQKNIEAARRSNQRRKRAYDDLVHVVELSRKTESKLRERQQQLVIENAALRLLIDRAEGRWKV